MSIIAKFATSSAFLINTQVHINAGSIDIIALVGFIFGIIFDRILIFKIQENIRIKNSRTEIISSVITQLKNWERENFISILDTTNLRKLLICVSNKHKTTILNFIKLNDNLINIPRYDGTGSTKEIIKFIKSNNIQIKNEQIIELLKRYEK